VEPVAALLMALATLSTAWYSFESAAWTRKSNRLMNEFKVPVFQDRKEVAQWLDVFVERLT